MNVPPHTLHFNSQTLQTAHQLESSVAQQHFQDFLSSDLAEFEFEKYSLATKIWAFYMSMDQIVPFLCLLSLSPFFVPLVWRGECWMVIPTHQICSNTKQGWRAVRGQRIEQFSLSTPTGGTMSPVRISRLANSNSNLQFRQDTADHRSMVISFL